MTPSRVIWAVWLETLLLLQLPKTHRITSTLPRRLAASPPCRVPSGECTRIERAK